MIKKETKIDPGKIKVPVTLLVVFRVIAVALWLFDFGNIGTSIGVGLVENMQIEGFFFYLLAGLYGGSVIHYLVAKLVGPLFFSRGWCGWPCWQGTFCITSLASHSVLILVKRNCSSGGVDGGAACI